MYSFKIIGSIDSTPSFGLWIYYFNVIEHTFSSTSPFSYLITHKSEVFTTKEISLANLNILQKALKKIDIKEIEAVFFESLECLSHTSQICIFAIKINYCKNKSFLTIYSPMLL